MRRPSAGASEPDGDLLDDLIVDISARALRPAALLGSLVLAIAGRPLPAGLLPWDVQRDAPGPLLVAGESLGSAVGALAAARRPAAVAGLLLVTPLASVPAVARRHYPFLPAFLLRDTLRTDLALPRYGGPVAFLVAGRDSIVFPDLGEALHRDYPGEKHLWVDGPADHNSLDYDPALPRWAEVLRFLLAPARRDR